MFCVLEGEYCTLNQCMTSYPFVLSAGGSQVRSLSFTCISLNPRRLIGSWHLCETERQRHNESLPYTSNIHQLLLWLSISYFTTFPSTTTLVTIYPPLTLYLINFPLYLLFPCYFVIISTGLQVYSILYFITYTHIHTTQTSWKELKLYTTHTVMHIYSSHFHTSSKPSTHIIFSPVLRRSEVSFLTQLILQSQCQWLNCREM